MTLHPFGRCRTRPLWAFPSGTFSTGQSSVNPERGGDSTHSTCEAADPTPLPHVVTCDKLHLRFYQTSVPAAANLPQGWPCSLPDQTFCTTRALRVFSSAVNLIQGSSVTAAWGTQQLPRIHVCGSGTARRSSREVRPKSPPLLL